MADTKITALSSAASLAATDILPVVADPGGTPANKKATMAVLSDIVSDTLFTGTTGEFVRGDGSIGTIDTGFTLGSPITSGTAGRLLYETSGNNIGEVSGATSDGTALTLTAPVLGTPASGNLSNCTALPPAGVTGTAAILGNNTFTGVQTLAENASIALDPAGSADEKWTGITVAGTAGATLVVGDLVYLNSAFKWVLADADADTTSGKVCLGLCVLAAAADTDPTTVLLNGTMRSAAFPGSITGGVQLYVSETAGDITTTAPTTTAHVVRVVGWAITTEPNTIYFNPSPNYFLND